MHPLTTANSTTPALRGKTTPNPAQSILHQHSIYLYFYIVATTNCLERYLFTTPHLRNQPSSPIPIHFNQPLSSNLNQVLDLMRSLLACFDCFFVTPEKKAFCLYLKISQNLGVYVVFRSEREQIWCFLILFQFLAFLHKIKNIIKTGTLLISTQTEGLLAPVSSTIAISLPCPSPRALRLTLQGCQGYAIYLLSASCEP